MTKTQKLVALASNFTMGGVDSRDYPDFCDAFIADCDIGNRSATEEELDILNEDADLVHELATNLFM